MAMPVSKIIELDSEGRGVAMAGTDRRAVPYVIPGEPVRIHPKPGKKADAPLSLGEVEIVNPSPDRVIPPCPYFGECGGCQLQHISLPRQLQEKQRWLQRLLVNAVPAEQILPVIASPEELHYRRRVQFQVGPRGEVGFYAPHSQRVVGIDRCLIAREEINQKIVDLRKLAAEALAAPRRPTLLSYEATLDEHGQVQIGEPGQERNFLQINAGANQLLRDYLKSIFAAKPAGSVLELFSGDGNLTFALRDHAKFWIAVESNAKALAYARAADPQKRTEWVQGDVDRYLSKFSGQNRPIDTVLLDPPRQGLTGMMEKILAIHPARVVYVSCNPAVLKKDLPVLLRKDYDLEQLQPFDFFPQTMHLETVCVLARRSKAG